MPLKVQLIMLQAAHELTNLDRVPAYASVDWAVGTIRKLGGAGMAGAANAVLRRIADLGPSAKEASFYRDGPGGQTGFLSRFYSCPEWIVGLWIDELGLENAEKLLIAQNAPPPVGLRLNAKKNLTSELYEELNSLPGSLKLPFPSLAFETTKTALMDRLPALLESGLLSRQSAAVMDILANLDFTTWPEPIFDACAGRGGKTFALLETGLSKVVAADLNFQRLKELLAESKRLDLLAPPTIRASATQTYPLNFRPRTILIDAPCSSLGVISRRPDVKWRMTETDMPKKAGMQAKMLQRAVDELEPGGRVVFITCTVSRLENEAHLDSILKNNKNCRLLAEARTPFDSPLKEFFYGFVLQK